MLAAALVLAGCGGDEDTPDDVTPGDAANDSNEDAAPSDTTGDTPGDTTGDTTTDVTPGDTPDDVTPDECNPGYVLTSDGCVDIDECALNTHNCPEDALCKNTDGSFECECQPGFVWDGQDCKDGAKWVAVV
ncbi:MAG TPA: calcium-binding EGF-like domain-containing protein, partial [Myxococcota bacterium]|nr:calcium-binding EGF-like domain-containing protein [Myxococcota bacterium]